MRLDVIMDENDERLMDMITNRENHLEPIMTVEDKDNYALCITVTDRRKAEYAIRGLFYNEDIKHVLKEKLGFYVHAVSLIDPSKDMDNIRRDIDEALAKNHIHRPNDPNFSSDPNV